jgi:excisionase family DNA binding protein
MPDIDRNEIEPYMSQADVADYLRVSQRTVRRWVQEKGLPCHRIGDLVRFRRAEVDAWVGRGAEAA